MQAIVRAAQKVHMGFPWKGICRKIQRSVDGLSNLVGGWATPFQKYESQMGWWNNQYMEKVKMFQTTNQKWIGLVGKIIKIGTANQRFATQIQELS